MLEKIRDENFLKEYRVSEKYGSVREELLDFYEKSNIIPMPLLFSKFRMYSETGERPSYERTLSQHINKLIACAYMAVVYGDEKYIRELEDCLYDVLGIYVWSLPAHIPDINEDNYYELDLSSCSIGATIASIKYLMGNKLHPLILKRIDCELRRRILEPFKSKIWHWEDRYNNWTAVCAGCIGSALMLAYPEEFDALKVRFDENMRKYLEGFNDDGVCMEGPGYWDYGFSNFVSYALLLKEYTKGKSDYFQLEKVKNIAMFFGKTALYDDVITNYGDCFADVKISKFLMYALKDTYGGDIVFPVEKRLHLPSNPFVQMLFYIEYYNPSYTSEKMGTAEYYMKDAGWYMKRTALYAIGSRGGTNGESHNHNDVASFIFAKDNKQIFCDIGTRQYTKDYFGEERYKYLETSSRGHNVPIINGQCQANVRETRSYTSFENGIFSVDYRELYDIKELKKLVRTYKCLENEVIIKDEYQLDGKCAFTERFVTLIKPQIEDGMITVDGVRLVYDKSVASVSLASEEHLESENAGTGERISCPVYLISLDLLHPESRKEFEFRIIP